MKKKGKIAMLAGLAAGTVAGLLFAPEEGKDLRKKIGAEVKSGGTGLNAVKKDLGKMSGEVVGAVKEVVNSEEVQKLVRMSKGKAEETLDKKKKDIDAWLKNIKKKAKDMEKRAESYAKEQKALLDGEVRSMLGLGAKKKSTPKKKKTSAKNKPTATKGPERSRGKKQPSTKKPASRKKPTAKKKK